MKPTKFLFILFLFLSLNLFSQKAEFKFGNVSMDDMKATVCPIDSEADAYYLGNYGNTYFAFQQDYFKLIYKVHFRIKILKANALDWGSFAINLYPQNGPEQTVESLKGNTYNLENGKIVITKLDKHSTFSEEFNKNFHTVKYTMPNVKVGSIIEVSYEINSDFISIPPWDFQHEIPVMYSEYQVDIPDFYSYKKFINGYEFVKSNSNTFKSSISLTFKDRSNGNIVSTEYEHSSFDYTVYSTKYYDENIKAFHNEPYMLSSVNYISSIEFELESEHFPNSLAKLYSHDWKSIQKLYIENEYFGGIIKFPGHTSDLVKSVTSDIKDSLQKAILLYNYIRDNFKWNGYSSEIGSKSLRKVLDDKSGNSADLNLLLIASMRKAGLNADPVVLSTRDNGLILISYPLMNKINYVIADLNVNGKQILLDITDKYMPFGLLPEKCLNIEGELVNENKVEDVELKSIGTFFRYKNVNCTLDSIGGITGIMDEIDKSYGASEIREKIGNAKNQNDYIQSLQKQIAGLTITKFEFKNLDSLQHDVSQHIEFNLSGYTESTGNLLMVHPLLYEQMKQNIFKLENRKFPVDYSYNHNETYVASFTIPVGYQVETLPKQISMSMPDKDITYSYIISQLGNKVQIMQKFNIRKSMFLPNEYMNLKEFYNQMVSKESEPIVLKKI